MGVIVCKYCALQELALLAARGQHWSEYLIKTMPAIPN